MSRTSVKTLAPQIVRGHSRTCFQRLTVDGVDHNPTAASSIFVAVIPITPLPLSPLSILDTFNRDLRFSFRCQACQVVRLLIVFSDDVLHVVVNFPNVVRNTPLPPRTESFLNPANCVFVFLSPLRGAQ